VTLALAIWPTIVFAAGARCPEETGLQSIRGNAPTSITFVNRLPIAVRIYWINYHGRRQYYGTVRPHKSYHQQTYLTHPWVVTDGNEDCIAVYMPAANPRRVIVTASAHRTEPSSAKTDKGVGDTTFAREKTTGPGDVEALVREQIAEACNGKPGSIDPASVIEHDLTGDGDPDLIIFHYGIKCEFHIRSGFCGAQECRANLYVRRGAGLHAAGEFGAVEWIDIGKERIPTIHTISHGGKPLALRWNGHEFRPVAAWLRSPSAARPLMTENAEKGSAALSETSAAHEIITLPNKRPQRSSNRNPSAHALIETWLGGYGWGKDKRFDLERYEIINRRVVWREYGRAFLQFRVLPLDGDAMALAAKRCPGRNRPIEMQIYFQWSADYKYWSALAERGGDAFHPCGDNKLWTSKQIELIVNPPPLPVPPNIAKKDVVTLRPGSPERKAILDGLRPNFETTFGKPILFRVSDLRVAAGFAWVIVHPQRPNGVQISKERWDAAVGFCEQDLATVIAEFWMRKRHDGWKVGWSNGFCATDSISQLGYLIGAPPQLVGLDKWPFTDVMPVEDPQYFELWKP